MSDHPLMNVVEAVLLAAGRPVTIAQMLELFEDHERPAAEDLVAALEALAERFEGTGVELREVASGWRVQVRQQHADVVSRLWQERPSRYSRALLETLALIAYRQPITRGEIEDIRGVTIATTIMRTLHERSWIRVVGHREVPGRPELLGTTREFLDYFGLKSLDDLNEQLELPGTPVAAIAADDVTGLPPPATVAVTAEEIVAEVFDDSAEESAEDESLTDDPELDAAGEREEGEAPTLVAGPPDSQER